MTILSHLLEPRRLLLIWQRPLVDSGSRNRRVVGEIVRTPDDVVTFRYLSETDDFLAAKAEGFQGYPAFRIAKPLHEIHVMEAFTCRLPSRRRGDFAEYLSAYSLPTNFSGSDFSLLAHTGGRLPGDGFEIVPELGGIQAPFDLIVEVAGTRYQTNVRLENVSVGDIVELIPEPTNTFDPHAVKVEHSSGGHLGYIPRPFCEMLRQWMDAGKLSASIQKLNGRPDRRLVYLFISVH